MAKINWKVRAKNPVWWAQLAAAVVLPLVAGVGMSWGDMTSWQTLGSTLAAAMGNPVVVVSMAVSAFNAITDPTTEGVTDSLQAMAYEHPRTLDEQMGLTPEARGISEKIGGTE